MDLLKTIMDLNRLGFQILINILLLNKPELMDNAIYINNKKNVVYYGLEELPNKYGNIIICNHSSQLDYGIIKNICNCYCITSNYGIPNEVCDKYQFIMYNNNDKEKNGNAVKSKILELIKSGNNVLIFPEGEFSYNKHHIKKFKKGLFHLAYDNKIPIVPIFQIHHNFYDGNYFDATNIKLYLNMPINNLDVDVTVNKTINPSDFGSFEELYDYIVKLYENKFSGK